VTTIAVRNRIMAADTQGTRSGSRIRIKKIRKLSDGSLFAGAGASGAIVKLQRWVEAGCPEDKPPKLGLADDEEVECIVLRSDGTLVLIDETLAPETLDQDFIAIGTGCEYALGAMACGRSAAQAVKIAARFDTNTSEPVEAMELASIVVVGNDAADGRNG
jgi:ATP-dependent protease HslVU (ClpYQ) peptidase subunit